ncbi:Opi1-domain-containing protein [Schizophyllum commune H4-8]|nr:Opi1-domain-containing protein [Schizophyllum commune H4-8]KAI5891933.1 Opi1-domain-containing protein [Schizophyllum commune H4-8]
MDFGDRPEDVQIAARVLGSMREGGAAPDSDTASTSTTAMTSDREEGMSALSSQTSLTPQDDPSMTAGPSSSEFLPRLQNAHPLFDSALRAYSSTKASSRVVKFGAEMMENTIMRVGERLVGEGIDEFAVRQLDRLDRYRRPSQSSSTETAPMRRKKTLDGTGSEVDSPTGEADWRSANMDVDERVGGWLESSSASHSPSYPSSSQYRSPPPSSAPSRPRSRSRSRSRSRTPTSHQPETPQPSQELLPTPNSRWQSLIMATPGVAAAVRISDDSRRRLRFVLGWLGYATQHIDGQILILRDLIASLQPLTPAEGPHDPGPEDEEAESSRGSGASSSRTASASASNSTSRASSASTSRASASTSRASSAQAHQASQTVNSIKKDLVTTVRQVVGVVSQYGGKGVLQPDARNRVRGFILGLPSRWRMTAPAVQTPGAAGAAADGHFSGPTSGSRKAKGKAGHEVSGSANTSATSSPRVRPYELPAPGPAHPHSHARHSSGDTNGHSRHSSAGADARADANATVLAAQRILVLATESLDMMRGVTSVVKDSLDRADAWVGRLGIPSSQGTPGDAHDADRERESFLRSRESFLGARESLLGARESAVRETGEDPATGLGLSRSSSTSSLRGLLDSTFPQGLEGQAGANGHGGFANGQGGFANGHSEHVNGHGHARHGSGSRLPELKLGIPEHRMNGTVEQRVNDTVEHRMEDGTPSAFAQGLPPLGSPTMAGSPSLAPRVGNLSLRDEAMHGSRPGSAMDLDS